MARTWQRGALRRWSAALGAALLAGTPTPGLATGPSPQPPAVSLPPIPLRAAPAPHQPSTPAAVGRARLSRAPLGPSLPPAPEPQADPEGTLLLSLRGKEPGLVLELHPAAPGALAIVCAAPCAARIPAGEYDIYVRPTASTLGGWRNFDFSEDTSLVFDPDTDLHLHVGLGLLAVAALSLAWAATSYSDGAEDEEALGRLGAVSLVAGTVGLIMAGTALKPEFERVPPQEAHARGRPGPAVPGPGLALRAAW